MTTATEAIFTKARSEPLWGLAFLSTALMPLMFIYARVGIEICSALIGLGFLWTSYRARRWDWLRTPFGRIGAITYLWLIAIVLPLSLSPSVGLTDTIFWFRLPLLVVAMRYWVLTDERVRIGFAYWVLVILALVTIDTLWQLHTGTSLSGKAQLVNFRLTGPFNTPKVGYFMSKLMVPVFAIAVMSALVKHQFRWVGVLLALLAVMVFTVLFTGERSAFLTVILALSCAGGLMMLANKHLRLPGLLLGVAAVVGFMMLIATNEWIQSRTFEAVRKFDNFSQSDYGLLINAGIKMGREHWLHGTGIGGYEKYTPTFSLGAGVPFHGLHPHNAYVEWFSQAGLPGVVLLSALVCSLMVLAWRSYRNHRGLACLLPAAAVGVVLQHFFPFIAMHSAFKNWSALLVWYSLAIMFAALSPNEDAAKKA